MCIVPSASVTSTRNDPTSGTTRVSSAPASCSTDPSGASVATRSAVCAQPGTAGVAVGVTATQ